MIETQQKIDDIDIKHLKKYSSFVVFIRGNLNATVSINSCYKIHSSVSETAEAFNLERMMTSFLLIELEKQKQ